MTGMIFHTNAISYVKVAAAQGPTLLLGATRPPAEVGAFKVGMAIAMVAGKPADPAWAAVLPRFAKLRAAGRGAEIRALIRQTSVGALIVVSLLGAATIILRDPLLRLIGVRMRSSRLPSSCSGAPCSSRQRGLRLESPLHWKPAGIASVIFRDSQPSVSYPFCLSVLIVGAERARLPHCSFGPSLLTRGCNISALRALRVIKPPPVEATAPFACSAMIGEAPSDVWARASPTVPVPT